MRIPTDMAERIGFYQELIRKCNSSRESRREFYRMMRCYYLFGVDESGVQDPMSRFNNIYPHIDQLSSFMFSPETTRFSVNLGPSVNLEEQYKVPPVISAVHREWHGNDAGGIDSDFKIALDWSSVYGSMFLKFRWKNWRRKQEDGDVEEGGQIQHFIVEPHNFGVLREDKRGLAKQEAFCETYYLTKTQLSNELEAGAHRDRGRILDEAQKGAVGEGQIVAGPVDRLILTAISGSSIIGNANMFGGANSMTYIPSVVEDLIEMSELYVYDDDIADYRVATFMNTNYPIWDRPLGKVFLPGCYPYVQLCPRPVNDYFFGHSEVEKLMGLQDMLNERLVDIRHLLKKQAHAPSSVTGETAVPEEMQLALDTPGGLLAVSSPAAKVEQHQPTIPTDLWNDFKNIKDMFGDISGLTPVNQGQSAKGVRSESHAQLMSQLGSARPKNRALVIEDSLDAVAQLIVKILKRYDKSAYREAKPKGGVQFFMHQFPDDFEAKVDGHSSSPVFMENYEQKVFMMLEAKMIDREEALMLLDIPLKDLLKHKLVSEIEPAESEAAEKERQLKVLSIQTKRAGGKGSQGNDQ